MALIEANTLSISESGESYVLSLLCDSGRAVSQTSRLAIYDTQHHVKPLLSPCVNGLWLPCRICSPQQSIST